MFSIKRFLFAAFFSFALAEDLCQANAKSPVQSFSSRTLYDSARSEEIVKVSGKGCTPVSMWVLSKHGPSYPSKDEILRFSELSDLKNGILNNHLKWGSGSLCSADVEELKNWNLNMTVENADRIIEHETETAAELAKRILSQFPKFTTKMNVKFSSTPKSKDSAAAFVAAIGGSPANEDLVDDKLLFKQEPTDEVHATTLFKQGEQMAQVIRSVAERLGFRNLRPYIVEGMYKLCTYDRLLNEQKTSPWCGLFTPEELKVMEYQEDLYSYHSSGYGHPEGHKKGCTLLFDMMHRLTNYRSLGKSTIYFTESEALRNLLVALGLQKDDTPITHENYATSETRSWKNSAMMPFNGNVMAVLHRCYGGLQNPDEYYITLYHNEKPVTFPWCGGIVCGLHDFVDHYTKSIEDGTCDLEDYMVEAEKPVVVSETQT